MLVYIDLVHLFYSCKVFQPQVGGPESFVWSLGNAKASPDLRGSANLRNSNHLQGLCPDHILLVHKTLQTPLQPLDHPPSSSPTALVCLTCEYFFGFFRFSITNSRNEEIKILHKVCSPPPPPISHANRWWAS